MSVVATTKKPKPVDRPLSALPKRQREFIKLVVEGESPKDAYVLAGYSDNRASMKNARFLYKDLQGYISKAFTEHMKSVEQAAKGYRTISELATEAESETVKMQCAKELISRAGYDEEKEVTVHHVHKNLSNEQLDARIAELQAQLGLTAKDITPIEGEAEVVSGE